MITGITFKALISWHVAEAYLEPSQVFTKEIFCEI